VSEYEREKFVSIHHRREEEELRELDVERTTDSESDDEEPRP
jgi:hypothetical protein